MVERPEMLAPPRYEFRVAEVLSDTVRAAFPELEVVAGHAGTVLFGPVRDAAALQGVLDRLLLFGCTVLDLHRLPD